METKAQILEELTAFLAAAEIARNDYYTKAVAETTAARARLSRFLETDPRGGAL